MSRIRTTDVHNYVGERVQLRGWLHALRRLGGLNFLLLRDGWGQVQAVTEDETDLAAVLDPGLGPETVLSLEGTVVKAGQAPGGYELRDPHLQIISPVHERAPAPLHKRKLNVSLPTLLDHAVVLNRHPQRRALFQLAAGVMEGFRVTLNTQHFTEIQTPKLVASATESGANVFEVNYFGKEAYLAQSPQFYKQIMVGVFERVYEVGPVFRAEPHDTSRHVNEYVSLDAEFGFIADHFEVMKMVAVVLEGIFAVLQQGYQNELELLQLKCPAVPDTIPHIHFTRAQELVSQHMVVDVRGELDLSPQAERWLGEWAQEEFESDFLFITGYPMAKRPFYTRPDPQRPQYSNSFDLLFRGTELITGGQRLHRYEEYRAALEKAGQPVERLSSYLEAFRYGMPPHGGFAIGLERFLLQLTNLSNIRLVTLFPRDLNRLWP